MFSHVDELLQLYLALMLVCEHCANGISFGQQFGRSLSVHLCSVYISRSALHITESKSACISEVHCESAGLRPLLESAALAVYVLLHL